MGTPDLQLIAAPGYGCPRAESASRTCRVSSPSFGPSLAMVCSDGFSSFDMDGSRMESLNRFRLVALCSFSPEMKKIWRDKIPRVAFGSPYLMHTILAIAAAYKRCTDDALNTHRTKREAYHSYQSAQLFNQMLSHPAACDNHGDSLWATAALLGMMAVTSIETSDPEEAWPLRPSHPSDLQWFRLNEEKKAVWNLTNPLRPGGLFQPMAHEYAMFHFQIPPFGAEGIPTDLAHVCGLNASSTPDNNPYFIAAHILTQTQTCQDRGEHVGIRMISFISQSQASFKSLLQQRDPVALMLLARWYAQARGALWWVQRRARVEGQAIQIYLKRLHHDYGRIRSLLPPG